MHYQGWNKNWDEWVDETRILKASSENFDRKEKLFAQHQVSGISLSVYSLGNKTIACGIVQDFKHEILQKVPAEKC